MMDAEQLTSGAVGLGILAAGVWNGYETYRTRAIAREQQRLTLEQKRKLDETHMQVAVNGHTSATPTLLDKVDTLTKEAQAAREAAADAALAAMVAGRMLEGHLERSADDRGRIWTHLRVVEQHLGITDERNEP